MPSNMRTVRDISRFFAARCKDEYRVNALREFTNDPRVNKYLDERSLSDVIYDWFIGGSKAYDTPAGRLLSTFDAYTRDSAPPKETHGAGDRIKTRGIYLYRGNAGKRQALRDIMDYVGALGGKCTVRTFTDESYEWMHEDNEILKYMSRCLGEQAAAGVKFERIQPPFNNAEFNFASIERWLNGFMKGAIQQYYYPWARDNLHRRTIFVVSGHIAMASNSVYGTMSEGVTLVTTDSELVDVYNDEILQIMRLCRPAMSSYSAESERLFDEAETTAAIDDVGVYKTCGLSVNTLPPVIIDRIRYRGTSFAMRMAQSFERRGKARANVLKNHTITDMMIMPSLKNVLSGKEPIPGTNVMPKGTMYYTPYEYKAHLERILWHLHTFANYRAVFLDSDGSGKVTMYVKGNSRALLIKQAPPFAVFDITERTMAAAFYDYLIHIAEDKINSELPSVTIDRITSELEALKAAGVF